MDIPNLDDVKQVIVMRKDLNMRKGKMIAQGSHASNMFLFDYILCEQDYDPINTHTPQRLDYMQSLINSWIKNLYKKIVVYVNSEQELLDIVDKAHNMAVISYKVYDYGLTEFHGQKTLTCAAIGPAESIRLIPITGHLPLL